MSVVQLCACTLPERTIESYPYVAMEVPGVTPIQEQVVPSPEDGELIVERTLKDVEQPHQTKSAILGPPSFREEIEIPQFNDEPVSRVHDVEAFQSEPVPTEPVIAAHIEETEQVRLRDLQDSLPTEEENPSDYLMDHNRDSEPLSSVRVVSEEEVSNLLGEEPFSNIADESHVVQKLLGPDQQERLMIHPKVGGGEEALSFSNVIDDLVSEPLHEDGIKRDEVEIDREKLQDDEMISDVQEERVNVNKSEGISPALTKREKGYDSVQHEQHGVAESESEIADSNESMPSDEQVTDDVSHSLKEGTVLGTVLVNPGSENLLKRSVLDGAYTESAQPTHDPKSTVHHAMISQEQKEEQVESEATGGEISAKVLTNLEVPIDSRREVPGEIPKMSQRETVLDSKLTDQELRPPFDVQVLPSELALLEESSQDVILTDQEVVKSMVTETDAEEAVLADVEERRIAEDEGEKDITKQSEGEGSLLPEWPEPMSKISSDVAMKKEESPLQEYEPQDFVHQERDVQIPLDKQVEKVEPRQLEGEESLPLLEEIVHEDVLAKLALQIPPELPIPNDHQTEEKGGNDSKPLDDPERLVLLSAVEGSVNSSEKEEDAQETVMVDEEVVQEESLDTRRSQKELNQKQKRLSEGRKEMVAEKEGKLSQGIASAMVVEVPLVQNSRPMSVQSFKKTTVDRSSVPKVLRAKKTVETVTLQLVVGCSRGRDYLRQNRYQEAFLEFSQRIDAQEKNEEGEVVDGQPSLGSDLEDCYRQRAYALFRLKQTQRALWDIDHVLQGSFVDSAQRSRDLFFRGRVYAAMGVYGRSITDFTEALQLGMKPRDEAHAYYLRGVSYIRMKRLGEGINDFGNGCQLGYANACEVLDKMH